MQDWRVADGRLECVKAAPGRNVHALTRELSAQAGTLTMSVKIGRLAGDAIKDGKAAAAFVVGAQGPLKEYRNNLIFGTGLNAGLRAKGELFIGEGLNGKTASVNWGNAVTVELRLIAESAGAAYRIKLTAHDATNGRVLGEVERTDVPAGSLVGNLALAANFGSGAAAPAAPKKAKAEADRWWFSDWRIGGTKITAHDDRAFGPLLFNQYTLHAGVLKMTVQLPPLGARDDQKVRLQTRRGGSWATVAEAPMDPAARTATLRVGRWNDQADTPYRVAYTLRATDGSGREHFLDGTVRRDPVDQPLLTVADISCNAHYAFPNTACAANVAKLNPDLLAFTGDQYYESSAGFGVDRSGGDASALDVLRRWAIHGWTWRELMRDRPSITIPDDHDVYHGNLWGEGGGAAPNQEKTAEAKGGYKMKADFVNAVHRMQTSHHPDSPAQAGKQGITGYYGPLTYGRVSFAVLADRQYKSGPDGKVNPRESFRPGVLEAEMDKSAGYGVIRFDKNARTIMVECWPLLADPTRAGTQFAGWPVVVPQLDNYARAASANLPELRIRGAARPVVEVVDESTGETLYILRLPGLQWRPHVFAPGVYTVRITEPETGKRRELKGVAAANQNDAMLEIAL